MLFKISISKLSGLLLFLFLMIGFYTSFSQSTFKHPRVKVPSQKNISKQHVERKHVPTNPFFSDTLTTYSFYRSDTLKSNFEVYDDIMSNLTCDAIHSNNNTLIPTGSVSLITNNRLNFYSGYLKKRIYLFHLRSLKHSTHLYKLFGQINKKHNVQELQLSRGVKILFFMLWVISWLTCWALFIVYVVDGNFLWILFLILGLAVFFVPLHFFLKSPELQLF